MTDYSKITALYSRLSVGDEDRDGGESNSIQNQKIFLENYARGQHLTNIRHYIDDDESGRFFDRSAYSRMMDDVENGKIGVCIMKDLTRWGRDYLQVGNAMEIFRRNNVRFIAVNNGIDSEKPDTLEFAPFINIMSEWYAKDISKKVKTGIKTKGMSGKSMVEVQALQQHIKNYRNTRQIYIEYRKSGYSKKFFEEHRQEITIHKAAKQAFDELQITKLPSMQSLYEEFHQLAVQKKQDYAEYRQIRKEKEKLLIAKRTVETILNIDRQKEQEKEQEKEEKKNFR